MAAAVVRRVQALRPLWSTHQTARGMATLKELSIRIKSVTNTEKITKSMKMVSAAKFKIAERELMPARVYGAGAQALFQSAEVEDKERKSKHLIIAISSDRGLCGSIHSGIARNLRALMAERPAGSETAIVCVGDKIRTIMQRFFRGNILMHFQEYGRQPPMFAEAAFVAEQVLNSGLEYDSAELIFNRFRNVISFRLTSQPLVPFPALAQSENLLQYDDVDEDTLRCFHEISLANLIYWAMKESAASEQSSRMTAMDAATKNAGEMIDALTLRYNRTRQAVITRELIEIISGAAAV